MLDLWMDQKRKDSDTLVIVAVPAGCVKASLGNTTLNHARQVAIDKVDFAYHSGTISNPRLDALPDTTYGGSMAYSHCVALIRSRFPHFRATPLALSPAASEQYPTYLPLRLMELLSARESS